MFSQSAFYQDANWVGPLVRLGNDAWLRRSIQVGITCECPDRDWDDVLNGTMSFSWQAFSESVFFPLLHCCSKFFHSQKRERGTHRSRFHTGWNATESYFFCMRRSLCCAQSGESLHLEVFYGSIYSMVDILRFLVIRWLNRHLNSNVKNLLRLAPWTEWRTQSNVQCGLPCCLVPNVHGRDSKKQKYISKQLQLNLELFTFSFTKGLSEGERFLRGVFAGYDGTLVRSIPPNQTLLVSDSKASAMAWWLQLRKDAEWQKARVNSVSGKVRKENRLAWIEQHWLFLTCTYLHRISYLILFVFLPTFSFF